MSLDAAVISVVVDNESVDGRFLTKHGFSAFVETRRNGQAFNILMDVGPSYEVFDHNLHLLGKRLEDVDAFFISHWHTDHAGALPDVLRLTSDVPIYATSLEGFFTRRMRRQLKGSMKLIEISGPRRLGEGVFSTGRLEKSFLFGMIKIGEHGLVLSLREKGLVLLVGCSHPGIDAMISGAREVSGENRVNLVLGGFHFIFPTRKKGVEAATTELSKAYVLRVAPCHCTGKEGIERIAKDMPSKFKDQLRVHSHISVESPNLRTWGWENLDYWTLWCVVRFKGRNPFGAGV